MKPGIIHLLILLIPAAIPARAAADEQAPVEDQSSLPAAAELRGTDAPSPGQGVDQRVPLGGAIADLVPLGRPTGIRDELAESPSGPASVVPEPATLAVFGVGLLLLFRRRSAS